MKTLWSVSLALCLLAANAAAAASTYVTNNFAGATNDGHLTLYATNTWFLAVPTTTNFLLSANALYSTGEAGLDTGTFVANGNYTAAVACWGDHMGAGVNPAACGSAGFRATTSATTAGIYYMGGGQMGAIVTTSTATNSATWNVGLSTYTAFNFLITRVGNTVTLSYVNNNSATNNMLTWTDTGLGTAAHFEMFLNIPYTAGNHTLADMVTYTNLTITATSFTGP